MYKQVLSIPVKIKVLSARHFLTSRLVTLVIGLSDVSIYRNAYMATMLDYECLNCCWLNARILDQTNGVENMGMGI